MKTIIDKLVEARMEIDLFIEWSDDDSDKEPRNFPVGKVRRLIHEATLSLIEARDAGRTKVDLEAFTGDLMDSAQEKH